MPTGVADILEQIDAMIQQGQGTLAQTELRALTQKPVPREHTAAVSRLAWRAGIPDLGLRLLHPTVRPPPKSPRRATAEEKAEYAACLVRNGAWHEADSLLADVDPDLYPASLLYRAFVLVAQWNYCDSIPLLERYLATPKLGRYRELVGKVNLAAALIYEGDTRRSLPLLRELLYLSSLRRYRYALGRVLELSAERLIVMRAWDEAEAFLAEAEMQLKESGGVETLFVRKFRGVVSLARGGDPAPLRAARDEASKLGHWETVRGCDRAEAVLRGDRELLQRLYFGTPYPHYRSLLLREARLDESEIPKDCFWDLQNAGPGAPVLDLVAMPVGGTGTPLREGSLLHRLLLALCADFYRPLRIASLHGRVYAREVFNPVSSPARLHDAMTRFRHWAADASLPLVIEEKQGWYWLRASAPLRVRIGASDWLGLQHASELKRLRQERGTGPFSMSDAVKALAMPRRSVLRLLQRAETENVLEKSGKASATRYRFSR